MPSLAFKSTTQVSSRTAEVSFEASSRQWSQLGRFGDEDLLVLAQRPQSQTIRRLERTQSWSNSKREGNTYCCPKRTEKHMKCSSVADSIVPCEQHPEVDRECTSHATGPK